MTEANIVNTHLNSSDRTLCEWCSAKQARKIVSNFSIYILDARIVLLYLISASQIYYALQLWKYHAGTLNAFECCLRADTRYWNWVRCLKQERVLFLKNSFKPSICQSFVDISLLWTSPLHTMCTFNSIEFSFTLFFFFF